MENGVVDTFGSPLLQDVEFNQDGSLKASGKQNVKFYNKKRLSFRAKRDENGDLVIDPKTGIPAKEAFEEVVEMVRVETRGDTNIKDDVANDLDRRQHYRQYKYFREGKIPDGNPIEDFDFLQPSTIMELHMHGVHVIQQVATMSDLVCEQLKDQSGFEVRDIAAQWCKINSPDGQLRKASALEIKVARLERELMEAKKGQPYQALEPERKINQIVDESVIEQPIETVELTPEQLASGPGKRKRRV